MCCAVLVVSQTFSIGNSSDQVHYQSQEGKGGRQQRIWVKKLYCQIKPSISKRRKACCHGTHYSLFLLPLGIQIVVDLLISYRHHNNENP